MKQVEIPRVVIAATQSGAGKTTIVTGVLGTLRKMGLEVQSYKVGPDYIDPSYHELAAGKKSHNLDTWLVTEEKITDIFTRTASGNQIAVIEGVMGLYDGGRQGISSTAAIAKLLKAPVILVIDVKSMGESAAAIVLGYKMYDPEVNLAGVIINRVGSKTHANMVCEAIEGLNIPVLGCIFRNPNLGLPERHLGLTPAAEHDTDKVVKEIIENIGLQVDIKRLLAFASTAPSIPIAPVSLEPAASACTIGVAQDEAFSFYYPESLDMLKQFGADIVSFSPLHDSAIPAVDGLILGGGFPEMFAKELSQNTAMLESIRLAARKGMPIYAECGGLMYLTRHITDFSGNVYEMAGIVPATCTMETKLQTVGYVEVAAIRDHVLGCFGERMRGHEFHFSKMIPDNAQNFPWAFDFVKMRTGDRYLGGFAVDNVLASYLHMHFAGNPLAAQRFAVKCADFKRISRQGLIK